MIFQNILNISQGHENIVQLLIDHGSCVNFEHPAMFNPLGLAARKGDEEVIKILLRNGADVNAKSVSGKKVHEGILELREQ